MCYSLWPHRLQHTSSLSFTISQSLLNSSPLSQWCHPTISFSVTPFSWTQSFPESGFFPNESALCVRWPKYCTTQHSQAFNPDSTSLFLGITRSHLDHGTCVTSSFIHISTSRPLPHPWRNCLEKRPKNLIEGIVSTILSLLCRLCLLCFSPTLNAHWP